MKFALCNSASPQVPARAHNSATDPSANVKLAANEGGLTSPRTSRQIKTSPPLLQIREEDEDSRGPSVQQQAKQQNQQQQPSQLLHSPSANSVGLRAPQPQERRGPSRSAHSPASLDNRPAVDERLIDLTKAAPAVHTPLSHSSKQSANAPQMRPASTDARAPVPKSGPPPGRPQSATLTTTASRRPPGPGPRTHYVGSPDQPDDRTARLLRSPALSHTSTLPGEVSPTQSRSERIAVGYGEQEFNRPRLADSPTTGRRWPDGAAMGPEINSRSSSSEDLDAHRSATDSEFEPVLAATDPFGPLVPAVRDPRERFVPLGARPPAPVFLSPQSPPIRPAVVEGYIDLSGAVPIPIPIPHRLGPPADDDRQPRRMLPSLQPGLPMQRPPPPMLQQQLDWPETHSLRGASGGRALPPQPPYPQARPLYQPPPIRAAAVMGGAAVREFAAGAPLSPQDRRGARPPSGAYDRPAPEQQSELSSSEGDWF